MQQDRNTRKKMGRPLSFDRRAALEAAMRVFWIHGYEGSSVTTLIRAMGISSPSLYTAFGDKKELFREAVHHYLTRNPSPDEIISAAPTAFEAAKQLMYAAAYTYASGDDPPGCLLASSAIAYSEAANDIGEELAGIRRGIEAALLARLTRGSQDGEFREGTDLDALAGSVMATIQGISTLARDGATRDKLLRIIDISVQCWPAQRAGAALPVEADDRPRA